MLDDGWEGDVDIAAGYFQLANKTSHHSLKAHDEKNHHEHKFLTEYQPFYIFKLETLYISLYAKLIFLFIFTSFTFRLSLAFFYHARFSHNWVVF